MTGYPILYSALVLGSVGLFFGFLIAMVNKKFQVWEDPRIDDVEELLPSTNCGACGQPGCRAFAEAVVSGKEQPSSCTVMGAEDVADVAAYLGVDAGEANKRVARLLCAGGKNEAVQISDYTGLESCKAAAAVAGGGKGCNWGCLGLADCEDACLLDAIYMNDDDLPVVIPDLCKNLLKGDAAEDLCSVACNTCNRCVADSEPGVIEMIDNLAVINYEMNDLTDPKALSRCPTGAIVWVEGQQFQESSTGLEKKVV